MDITVYKSKIKDLAFQKKDLASIKNGEESISGIIIKPTVPFSIYDIVPALAFLRPLADVELIDFSFFTGISAIKPHFNTLKKQKMNCVPVGNMIKLPEGKKKYLQSVSESLLPLIDSSADDCSNVFLASISVSLFDILSEIIPKVTGPLIMLSEFKFQFEIPLGMSNLLGFEFHESCLQLKDECL